MAESYYSARSRRDPDWHAAQLAGAAKREARRRELDPDGLRAARRLATRRYREKQAASGFTFHELWQRVGGERATPVTILNEEVRRGRIDYRSTSRRYSMNGALPDDVRRALRDLEL